MGIVRYFGMVANKDNGKGLADLRVEAWDVDGVLSDAVAITTTGADGRFDFILRQRDIDRLFNGRSATVKFKIVSGSSILADTATSHTWSLRGHARGRIDVNPSLPIGIASSPPRFVVRGTVVDVNTGPVSGATVQAFDRNVTSSGVTETSLGADTAHRGLVLAHRAAQTHDNR